MSGQVTHRHCLLYSSSRVHLKIYTILNSKKQKQNVNTRKASVSLQIPGSSLHLSVCHGSLDRTRLAKDLYPLSIYVRQL